MRKLVDAKEFLKVLGKGMRRRLIGYEALPPTKKQRNFLVKLGIDPNTVPTIADASRIIDIVKERDKNKLAAPAQLVILGREKHRSRNEIVTMTKKQVDELFGNCKVIKKEIKPPKMRLYRVTAKWPDGHYSRSHELFQSELAAGYAIAKHIPPEVDAIVENFIGEFWYVKTEKPRFFVSAAQARQLAKETDAYLCEMLLR